MQLLDIVSAKNYDHNRRGISSYGIGIGIGIGLITLVLSYHHNNGHMGEDPTIRMKKTTDLPQYQQNL